MLCIRELTEQFEIQGAFCIKICDDVYEIINVLAEGEDFECDRWDINENILEREITHMYAENGVLNIEVE